MSNPFLEPDIDRWSEETRRAYELEVLREVTEQLGRVAEPSGRDVLEIELQGDYPDTLVFIRLWEHARDIEVTRNYPIWKGSTFVGWRGVRESPYSVGMLMTTWALGG